ncbi:MAG: septum formation inhibitor Maf [Porticoccaceae bacterium]|nr:septum formation inhibitor Maf [Porticoccaceae bacterium]
MLLDPHILLASASPRRSELLTQIGVRFAQLPVDIDESQNPGESPVDYVSRMAVEKAQSGWARQTGLLPALGADTTVVCGEQIFGKPVDQQDALNMLSRLSGATHQVLSAVSICRGDELAFRLSKTSVRFRSISSPECLSYWQTGEPIDKAGAYGIQGMGAVFVADIEGSYSGVVGLPLAQTAELLNLFKIPVWQTLEP